ncbi:uncharacterized protein LOC112049338 isoform X2 [Bicyclus anynana]|uniref:Uncharacterized protein LOC112049338 isoform X2 n=1 Tax=Bicyclus anynana TaxID=110368 RepID=A0A6J1N532_BICAN|nr:uncharacterized protein LOC112049338 isoform X2 [Bicyclus anynana]
MCTEKYTAASLHTGMKMTMSTSATMSARVHRKVMRAPHKRAHPGKLLHAGKMVHPGKHAHLGKFGKLGYAHAHAHAVRPPDACENSNDSGLGPDPVSRLSDAPDDWEPPGSKRRRDDGVKVECDDAIDAYSYATVAPPAPLAPPPPPAGDAASALPLPAIRAGCSISSPSIAESQGKRIQEPAYRSCGKFGNGGKLAGKFAAGGKLGGKLGGKYGGKLAQALARRRALAAMSHSGPPGLAAPLSCKSRDGAVELQILCQPETQHRARYQTEGSRGAVKDNSGNGFPVVKLVGYDKPAVLQVFIGTDTGRVAPHMFYQACRVSGKNSTPCKERKDDGTVVIEIDLEPGKNWQVTCDCVGILKERNVDVEHRFGETLGGAAHAARGKKKSTRCRMVFRTEILDAAGQPETLQVCSTQIICTQPPGVPEVCRKSLVSCPASGGLELYLLGKNFLKETRVVFRLQQDGAKWEEEVVPDKEFLQQTHLVCCVPPYQRADIAETVCVQLFVRSGGKASEPHAFYYTPAPPAPAPLHCTPHPAHAHAPHAGEERPLPMCWGVGGMGALMPPPQTPTRRSSIIVPDPHSPLGLKSEVADESSQHSLLEGADGEDKPLPDELRIMDLRLKSEVISRDAQQVALGYDMKLSPGAPAPPEQPSSLVSFTQTLQAIQNQVQTDKMVESVTAAIFNTDPATQMYVDQPILTPMDSMRQLMSSKAAMDTDMKALGPELMMADGLRAPEPALLGYEAGAGGRDDGFNPFGAMTKMEASHIKQRLARQSAHMEALVEDAMKATAAMLPADAAKLDELVNSRVDDHLSGASGSPAAAPLPDMLLSPTATGPCLVMPPAGAPDELMMMPDMPSSVKTPPAAVKSMILNAAAEILTSDSTMNALVTSAINTANILSTESDASPPAEPAAEAPLSAMSQAVSQAVTQAVSQAVSHAVSQAVSQEMTAPVQGLTAMSDQDLLSYINPSTFDQV